MKTLRLIAGGVLWFAAGVLASGSNGPNLLGRVTSESGGPLAKATVFIYTAGPRTGTASTCPSCYVDCRKKAQTDADGHYRIEALDPSLLFRVLVIASGYEAQFISKVDPAVKPFNVVMKPLDEAAIRSKAHIEGVVLDYDGNALPGAVIGPEGVERGTGTQWGGTDAYVDPVAVTDDHGRFLLRCTNAVKKVHAIVEGRGVAKRWAILQPGRDHLVRMEEGVAVTGRILRDGKPVKDATVALATIERRCGVSLHDFEAVTDGSGYFSVVNVTPEHEYYLFTKMESLGSRGALPLRNVKTGVTATVIKLGDLPLEPGHRVAGRLVLTDGKPIPDKTRLFLGRQDAWDFMETELAANGDFEFKGVPLELVQLSVRIKGYKFSKANPSLDRRNGLIEGRVEKDIDELVLVMEPGEHRYNNDDDSSDTEGQPREKALRSAKL